MRAFGTGDTFLGADSLFFSVSFIAFDIEFYHGSYLGQRERQILGEGLTEVSRLKFVLEHSCEHLLVRRDYIDYGFVEAREIVPQ